MPNVNTPSSASFTWEPFVNTNNGRITGTLTVGTSTDIPDGYCLVRCYYGQMHYQHINGFIEETVKKYNNGLNSIISKIYKL